MEHTIKQAIGWDDDSEEIMHEFPAVRVPEECDECRGDGTTVAPRLKGMDFSPEELQRNGDWDDYVSHEGIWAKHTCSECNGSGAVMSLEYDMPKIDEAHAKEYEMMCDHQQKISESEEADRRTAWGEGGWACQ